MGPPFYPIADTRKLRYDFQSVTFANSCAHNDQSNSEETKSIYTKEYPAYMLCDELCVQLFQGYLLHMYCVLTCTMLVTAS